ncbi:MAG: hypothetical protein KC422_17260 [Trueperaceae bacterium]|nr:hypothetical protein [Trueperaceae bacterium]
MNPLVLGVGVFIIVSSVIMVMMLLSIRNAKAEGITGQALVMRILPLILADAAFVAFFAYWLLRNL